MKKLDYKLVNIALICLIVFLLIKSSELWILLFDKIFSILLPICIGFAIAYFLYPILIKLNKKIPKVLSIGILILSILLLIITIISLAIPILYKQALSLISYIMFFIKDNNINIIESNLSSILNEIDIEKIISGGVKTINTSIDFITNFIIVISSLIYFLIDMDKIRYFIKKYLSKKYNKLYLYFKTLDNELNNYFKGFSKLIIISFFEYTLIYYLLGHPHVLLLGFLSAISNLIPCFGGIVVALISFIISFTINTRLGITVLVITFILSIFDSYILNPLVYGKSNKIHPLVVIISVFAGGIIFGSIGVLISLPISIIIITTFKFLLDNH